MHENDRSVSVIIPAKFEDNKQLTKLLSCLTLQLIKPSDEMIIVDGRPGSRESLLDTFKTRWVKDPNLGIAGARNAGIEYALSQVLVFMDADCLPGPDSITSLRRLATPGVLVQAASWDQENTSTLDSHHHLWRKIVTIELARQHPAFVVNGRAFAIDRETLTGCLGERPFKVNPNIHGGEDKLVGINLKKYGVPIRISEEIVVQHTGDPHTLRGLLMQKFTHGKGDAITGVLPQDTFQRNNFERTVLIPTQNGVNSRLALLFWTYYLLGAFTGIQSLNKSNQSNNQLPVHPY